MIICSNDFEKLSLITIFFYRNISNPYSNKKITSEPKLNLQLEEIIVHETCLKLRPFNLNNSYNIPPILF